MGLTNLPVAGVVTDDGGIASVADATAKNPVGAYYNFMDSDGRWSMVRYYQAGATIAQGDWLMKDTADRTPARFIQGTAARGEQGRGGCFGIAAANVSNTGYYSFCYIAGYCPAVAMPTLYASNQPMKLSATYAGRFTSTVINATVANNTLWNEEVVIWSLGVAAVSTANSTASAVIKGWLL